MAYAISDDKGAVTYDKDVKPIISQQGMSCYGSGAPAIEEFDRNKE